MGRELRRYDWSCWLAGLSGPSCSPLLLLLPLRTGGDDTALAAFAGGVSVVPLGGSAATMPWWWDTQPCDRLATWLAMACIFSVPLHFSSQSQLSSRCVLFARVDHRVGFLG